MPNYEEVTSPIITDDTGQDIVDKLDEIVDALTPTAAEDITFDNTGTGMQATDVQDAVVEINSSLTNLTNKSQIYFRKQTGTFSGGACSGLDCPSGFDNSAYVFFSAKYQNSVFPILNVGLSSGTPTLTTYTVYGTTARGGTALANGTYEWFEIWVK